MPRPVLQETAREVAVICNITDQEWLVSRNYGVFIISPREDGEEFSLTSITERFNKFDLGDKNVRVERVSPYDIADDISKEINGDAGEASYHGVFVVADERTGPTVKELKDAHAKLQAFYIAQVRMADSLWEQMHNPTFIDARMRRAARYLNLLDKPWLFDTKPMAECPACGDHIKPGVAVCKSCGAILDREKAEKFGLVQPISTNAPEPAPVETAKKVRTI